MLVPTLRIKSHFNQDFISLCVISILVSLLIIIENNYFSMIYLIGIILGIGLFTLVLKYPKLGLYLLIFNLPLNLYVPLFGFGGDRFSVSVNEMLMLVLLVAVIVKKMFSGRLSFPNSHLNRPILLLIAVNALSLFLAVSDLSSANYMKCWLYFLLWAEYFLIYFLILDLVKTDKEIKIIFALLIAAAVISVLSAIYQHIIGSPLHSIGVVTATGKTYYRLATPFGFYSNHFGAYLLILLSMLFHFYFISKKRIYLVLIFPILFVLFFTFSRASFLGFIILVATLAIQLKEHRKKILVFTLSMAIISLIIFTPVFLRWTKKAPVIRGGRIILEHNIVERLSQWEAALNRFMKYPLIGKGFHTYAYRNVDYISNFGKVKTIDHPDNTYVKLLIESGVLGLLAFLMFVYRIFYFSKNALKCQISDDLRTYILINISALICLMITMMFETMFTVGRVTGPFFVLLGLTVIKARMESIKI
jgi:putative inorganic carbon (HCO3(-)) transporter